MGAVIISMKIRRLVALALVVSVATLSVGCGNYEDNSDNILEKQQFALSYFKALGEKEETVVSPLLAMVTIGELSGVVNNTVKNKSLALIDSKKDTSSLNILCGKILSELQIDDTDSSTSNASSEETVSVYGEQYATSNNIGYSSNFIVKLEDEGKTDGFSSAYISNLSNLYHGSVNSYSSLKQYNTLSEMMGSYNDFSDWHPYNEEDISLINKLTYINKCTESGVALKPCNIETESKGKIKGIVADDIVSCTKSDMSLSCKIASGDTGISLVLMMPTDENMTLTDYISSMTLEEFNGLTYEYWYDPWCKDTDGYNFSCVFPELSSYSVLKDTNTYEKLGLGSLFNAELLLDGSNSNNKLYNIVQYTGIEIKSSSEVEVKDSEYDKDRTMIFDRPFIYALIEDEYNYPLIMGRVDKV